MEIYSREQVGLGPWQNRRPFTVEASKRRGVVIHHDRADKPIGKVGWDAETRHLRAIQRYHQGTRGWSDIAYSFAVGQGSGNVYELRGWYWDQFANGSGQENWYTVLWIGGKETPTPAAEQSILWLIDEARGRGAGARVWPHNKLQAKPCPGPDLTRFAANWDGRPIPEGDDMTPAQKSKLLAVAQQLEGMADDEHKRGRVLDALVVMVRELVEADG